MLEMLPYPSGEPHIGHLKNYSIGDAVAHFRRRQGMRVLHPMGYDAFGLPAENHAISTGQHPRESTNAAIASFQRQFREWGISIDWSREFGTHEPRYYRWTQWIFLKLFERGLAYRGEAAVKWCPHDQTVLANEQVIDGRCERCGHLVEVRQLEQWFFRITDYADRLLDDLDTIEWPAHVKTMQRNWIGRSEGAEVTFRNEELGIDYPVFTTRPDTLFGATFFVMAPEHPDVFRLVAGTDAGAGGPRVRQPRADRGQRGSRRRRPREDRRVPGPPRHQPRQRRAPCPCTWPTTCSWSTGPARSWPCPPTTRATTSSRASSACPSARSSPAARTSRPRPTRATARSSTPTPTSTACPIARRSSASWPGWTARARATRRSTTACATGCSRASATGAARSRSSTASAAASSRCPRTSSPSCCPTSPTTRPRGARRWPRPRTGSTWPAPPAAARRGARPTPWTPSSTRPGTSCATRTPTTTRLRGTPTCWRAGCRSTSTSAASSTRSCT